MCVCVCDKHTKDPKKKAKAYFMAKAFEDIMEMPRIVGSIWVATWIDLFFVDFIYESTQKPA